MQMDTLIPERELTAPSSTKISSPEVKSIHPSSVASEKDHKAPGLVSQGAVTGGVSGDYGCLALDSDDEKEQALTKRAEKKVFAPTDRVETPGQFFRRRQGHLPAVLVELRLLRGMFKADFPYRSRLSAAQDFATSAAGVVNLQYPVGNLSTTAEWTSIDALFDECFVHSLTMHFEPYNANIGSGYSSASGAALGLMTSTTASATTATNAGLIVISLFGGSGYYSAAAGMSNNPTRAYHHSSKPFAYTWRNNVKFQPHGIALTPPSSTYWQGWCQISSVANYGGNIQARTTNDVALGDGGHVFHLGAIHWEWDVSFRSRA